MKGPNVQTWQSLDKEYTVCVAHLRYISHVHLLEQCVR